MDVLYNDHITELLVILFGGLALWTIPYLAVAKELGMPRWGALLQAAIWLFAGLQVVARWWIGPGYFVVPEYGVQTVGYPGIIGWAAFIVSALNAAWTTLYLIAGGVYDIYRAVVDTIREERGDR